MRTAIVLIAHGSRRREANAELARLADRVQARLPGLAVAHAFLELAAPTIPQAVQQCVAEGAREVRLFPYFLSAGVHVTRDLEDYRCRFCREYPGVEFRLLPPLGAHPALVELVLELLAREPAS